VVRAEKRISVRFEHEWHDDHGQWCRTRGDEHWEFDADGLMRRRDIERKRHPALPMTGFAISAPTAAKLSGIATSSTGSG
jgi:hypothetical protein